MHAEQRQRAARHLSDRGVASALFANPLTVKWLTGFAPAPQLGPNPFAGGPPLVLFDDGQFTLIVVDSFADDAAATGCSVISYAGYTVERPIAGAARLADALREALAPVVRGAAARGASGQGPFGHGPFGVEERDLPASLWALLRDALPAARDVTAIDDWLTPLRMVKTDEEVAKLRENFALTDIGHAAARRAVQAGRREIDVWVAIEDAIQQAAGQRVPVGNDCVVGYRENNVGGWPGDLEIRPHDAVVVDLSTLRHGYWSDSCATYYAAEPTQKQREMHRTAAEALQFAISLIKPGAVASEIDRSVRAFMADAGYPVYPHHTGHSVGVSGHEEPRIVPYNDQRIEQGMVLMLEPGIYYPGETGVRLEDAVLVTASGAEVLTHHDKSLP